MEGLKLQTATRENTTNEEVEKSENDHIYDNGFRSMEELTGNFTIEHKLIRLLKNKNAIRVPIFNLKE